MKNRKVGLLILGISAIVGFIIYSFNRALTDIVETTCSHGSECVMWDILRFQTNISIGLMAFIILIGLYLIFFTKEKKKLTKTKEITLDQDEKLILEKIKESEGTIFQSDLVEKTDFNKVKVTRILDKLEGRKIIERKRRGMTNVVILKE